jgi:catechol 2,3-dioxygenase-like lactoylglutathione lyase family enzyme
MPRRFDHVDLRVSSLAKVQPFYEALLPALGFTRDAKIEDWLQFEAPEGPVTEFFGVTESTQHQANENRIAFWAESPGEVDQLAAIAITAGAINIEGPGFEAPHYYAVFFEDPCGNRLEICHRLPQPWRANSVAAGPGH